MKKKEIKGEEEKGGMERKKRQWKKYKNDLCRE